MKKYIILLFLNFFSIISLEKKEEIFNHEVLKMEK